MRPVPQAVRQGAILSIIAAALVGAGLMPPDRLFGSLAFGFTIGGAVAMFAALRRRDGAARGGLNGWDRCLSYNALAIAMRLLQGLFTQP